MHVKGFILEDDQGREFVLECEWPYTQIGQRFFLRGWQRRRLVPLPYTELELRKIFEGVLVTLHTLFEALPRFLGHREDDVLVGHVTSADSRENESAHTEAAVFGAVSADSDIGPRVSREETEGTIGRRTSHIASSLLVEAPSHSLMGDEDIGRLRSLRSIESARSKNQGKLAALPRQDVTPGRRGSL